MLDTDLCWCGSNKAYKDCHKQFDEHLNSIKLKAFKGQKRPPRNIIKNEKDIEGIRKSGIINNGALDLIASKICAGMDTETINLLAHNYIVEHGGIPACLNYEGYPKSICVSINNVVCHGIPSRDIVLKDGDIVNVDVTTILDGYYADASRMFMIGNVSNKARKLVEVTKECMEIGIKAIKPWSFVGDIGAVVEHHAHKHGYSVVEDLVRMNIISEEEAMTHPIRNHITRAMGTDEMVIVDIFREKLKPQDKILMATDGLTGYVLDDKIKELLKKDEDLDVVTKNLINFANEVSGKDNTSVILIQKS